ncbi:MAG: hypothetical protein LBD20_10090 [Spirochaetaceae bacterium]|jgi:hypothetical protein|nr:hypothetical protein [Spirochaetaceae bacterium]
MEELTLEKVLEDAGLTAKWEARGKERWIALGKEQGMAIGEARVLDLLKSGKPPEEILKLYGEAGQCAGVQNP